MSTSGSSPIQTFLDELDKVVFGIGVVVAGLAVLAFMLQPDTAQSYMWDLNDFLWTELGWFYLGVMFFLVVFVFFLILGPWGKIKLGKEDEDPEFSFLSYFVMLFSAAIAAGIVFWGPAEGIFHFDAPAPWAGAEAHSSDAAVGALQATFFHWGISAWSAYVVMAIPIAYLAYRYDGPMRISTVIAPWVGLDNLDGFWAKTIDVIAVFATIGGVATTLGLVGSQFLIGLDYMVGVNPGDTGTVVMITGLTIAFTISVAAGIRKGIRRISYFNVTLFTFMMIAVFVLGPTAYIMTVGTEALGNYVNDFITMSFYTGAEAEVGGLVHGWVGGWTVFYWAWWFSWAPFVGLFIARISRGRTVRQVALTGVFASTGVTIPWFATMGGTSIFMESQGTAEILGTIGEYGGDEAAAGYPMFEALAGGGILMVLFLILITTFFITSADSSTLALGMLTTGGETRPSTINRVIWGGVIGLLASMLMVVGGVDALQAAAIITGGPFAIILIIAVVSMSVMFGKRYPVFLGEEGSIPGTNFDFDGDRDRVVGSDDD